MNPQEDLIRKHAKVVEELIELKDHMDALEERLRNGHQLVQKNSEWILVDPTGHTVAAGKSLREMDVLKGTTLTS